MASDWEFVPRCYEVSKNHLQLETTYDHPLKHHAVTMVDSKGTRGNCNNRSFGSSSGASSRTSSNVSLLAEPLGLLALDGTDPLSLFARQVDPLSKLASEYETFQKSKSSKSKISTDKDFQSDVDDKLSWSVKRLGILNRFTTSEKLSISTSFLSTGHAGTDTIKAQTIVADKVRFRLEQLDNFEDGSVRHMMNLTQQEYIQRIEQLNHELVQSWNNDQRVKALKIGIQCAKMLADTSVLQFYPSQFVLITDILDIFGKLVYERLAAKANTAGSGGVDKKMSEAVLRESARETCQNWFYKIASIREALPRLYVEMALIKCYEFLSQCEFDAALLRLTKLIRGIGDPLVATYARCYLVRVGLAVTPNKDYIRENFQDFLSVYHMIFSGAIRSELNRQRVDIGSYLALYGPALDFLLQALVHRNGFYTEEILAKCKEIKNNGPLLMSILLAFKSEFIAAHALEFAQILAQSNTDGVPKAQLFRALGSSVSRCPPLQEQRLAFLQTAFHTINTFTDPAEYVNCVQAWSQFIAENFTIIEVNRFLGEVSARMNQGKAYEKHFAPLQSILDMIVQHYKNISALLIQENFLPYLDLFHKESVKIEVCKNILEIFKRSNQTSSPSDFVIVTNALMYVGKILNDSVTAVTVEDERRQISQLISAFIRKVDFGRDLERTLAFYVEARGTFANLDAVHTTLVHAVNKLIIETRRIVDGHHTRKTAAFVRACVAFCFITVPSIASAQTQMDLYLLSGQVALLNLCLGQADACFEAALHLVGELPRSIEVEGKVKILEPYLVSYLCNMLATLVVVPDSPEQGVLYLFRLLLDMMQNFTFEPHSTGPTTIYLHALDMLYVQSLEEFPYHIPEVVSNDELYGHDPKFLAEINNMSAQVVESILGQLKTLGSAQQLRTQATLALELFLRIVRFADLSKEKTFQLAINLWTLALKQESHLDQKLISRTFKSVEDTFKLIQDGNGQHAQSLAQLLVRMRGNSDTKYARIQRCLGKGKSDAT